MGKIQHLAASSGFGAFQIDGDAKGQSVSGNKSGFA